MVTEENADLEDVAVSVISVETVVLRITESGVREGLHLRRNIQNVLGVSAQWTVPKLRVPEIPEVTLGVIMKVSTAILAADDAEVIDLCGCQREFQSETSRGGR